MIKRSLFFLVIQIFFAASIHAESAAVSLTQLLNNLHTVQANFTQNVVDNRSGKKLQQSQGRMALLRPGKFRWEIVHPNSQLIITNGRKIWIYDPDLEQVTIRFLQKEAGEAPALLLSNPAVSLTQDFEVQMQENSDSSVMFLLTPRNRSSMFVAIKLGFSGSLIKSMQLEDHLGHVTQVQFSAVKTNVNLPASLFNFHAPRNIDVIDETH